MRREVGFDRVGGRLRLTRRLLAEMCALHAGQVGSDETGLGAAGLLEGDRLHPALDPVAETAARPLVRLALDLEAKTPLHCEGWMGDRFALLLAAQQPTAEVLDATFLSRSLLCVQLARFVDLGPRPRAKVTEPIEIDRPLLEALLGGPEPLTPSQLEILVDPRDEIVPAWFEVLSALSRPRARWRAGVWWNSVDESPEARSLEILDSAVGLIFVSHVPRGDRRYARVSLRLVTPSQVWRLLCAMVPGAGEVTEPLRP